MASVEAHSLWLTVGLWTWKSKRWVLSFLNTGFVSLSTRLTWQMPGSCRLEQVIFLDTKIDASIFQIPICGLSSYNLPESFLSDTASWWRMLRGWSDLPPIGRRFQNSLHSEPRMCCVLQCLFMSCCKQSISVRLSLCTKGVSLWWSLPWTCFTAHRVSTWCGWVTIASKVPTWLIHLPNGY